MTLSPGLGQTRRQFGSGPGGQVFLSAAVLVIPAPRALECPAGWLQGGSPHIQHQCEDSVHQSWLEMSCVSGTALHVPSRPGSLHWFQGYRQSFLRRVMGRAWGPPLDPGVADGLSCALEPAAGEWGWKDHGRGIGEGLSRSGGPQVCLSGKEPQGLTAHGGLGDFTEAKGSLQIRYCRELVGRKTEKPSASICWGS